MMILKTINEAVPKTSVGPTEPDWSAHGTVQRPGPKGSAIARDLSGKLQKTPTVQTWISRVSVGDSKIS